MKSPWRLRSRIRRGCFLLCLSLWAFNLLFHLWRLSGSPPPEGPARYADDALISPPTDILIGVTLIPLLLLIPYGVVYVLTIPVSDD